ncbi:MAG: hypothetical protein P9L98_03160 [Candidatus Kaelpia imicola]|nr:hypothetical protein [Candidatus Kaelpia imicola]
MINRRDDIKAVIFDLGNVIVYFDHMIAAKKISEFCSKSPESIYSMFFSSALAESFDSGIIGEGDFFEEVKKVLGIDDRLNQEDFYEIWNDIFWINESIIEIIKETKRLYGEFSIISNINKPHFEYIWQKFGLVREASKVVLSYEEGVLKPNKRIYKCALDLIGHLAPDVFYTDDRIELVTAAEEMGFKAVQFNDAVSLKQHLFKS